MKVNDEILNCPCCNSRAVLNEFNASYDRFPTVKYYVCCTGCGLTQPMRNATREPWQAINAWNKRYDNKGMILI